MMFPHLHMFAVELVMLSVLLGAFVIQLAYWIYYSRLSKYHHPRRESDLMKLPPVSVIAVVNDDSIQWLEEDFKDFFCQDHPNYELVIVNDCGGEDVEIVLKRLSYEFGALKYTSIPIDRKFRHTKKVSKLVGIKCASYENLLFIEPWCKPSSSKWLSLMSQGFLEGRSVVIGYSTYYCDKDCRLVRTYNFLGSVRSLACAAISGKPYSAARFNYGFTKTEFFSSGGYNYKNLEYGENDLYIQRLTRKENTSIIIGPGCQICRKREGRFKDWFINECMVTSIFRHYPLTVKLYIFFDLLSSFVFWISIFSFVVYFVIGFLNEGVVFCTSPSSKFIGITALSILFIRQSLVFIISRRLLNRLRESNLCTAFLWYDKIAAIWEMILCVYRRLIVKS